MRGWDGCRDPPPQIFFQRVGLTWSCSGRTFFLAPRVFGSTPMEGESSPMHSRILRWSRGGLSPQQVLVVVPCQSYQLMQWWWRGANSSIQ